MFERPSAVSLLVIAVTGDRDFPDISTRPNAFIMLLVGSAGLFQKVLMAQ